jgi:hypothetical protein
MRRPRIDLIWMCGSDSAATDQVMQDTFMDIGRISGRLVAAAMAIAVASPVPALAYQGRPPGSAGEAAEV